MNPKQKPPIGWFFLFPHPKSDADADIRQAESAFTAGGAGRLCIPPLAVYCHARRSELPYRHTGTPTKKRTPSGKLCLLGCCHAALFVRDPKRHSVPFDPRYSRISTSRRHCHSERSET